MSTRDVQAVRDLMVMRARIFNLVAAAPAVSTERIAEAIEVLDLLVAGANGGREAFLVAADKVYVRLQRPRSCEIRDLAARVAPSTRSSVDVVAAVLTKRVEGGTWVQAGRQDYLTDSTARRWAELAVMSQRRFWRVFERLPPDRLPLGAMTTPAPPAPPGKEVSTTTASD